MILLSSLSPVQAEAVYAQEKSVLTLHEQAQQIAQEFDVPFSVMNKIITDESNWNPDPPGSNDGGDSVGIVQINLPNHSYITRSQALDPIFSIRYLASEIAAGRESQWTICNCFTELKRLGVKISRGEFNPNTPYPRVGGAVFLIYGGVKHYAYVESVASDGIHIKESNYYRCERSQRVLSFNDSHIIGYWHEVD